MSYIDWNIAKNRGRGTYFNKEGRIYYRDGSTDKSASYRFSFANGGIMNEIDADSVIFGASKDGDYFLTTKNVPNADRFEIKRDERGRAEIYGKDPVRMAIKTLTGIDPSGDVIIDFDLKSVGNGTYKFTDIEIK